MGVLAAVLLAVAVVFIVEFATRRSYKIVLLPAPNKRNFSP